MEGKIPVHTTSEVIRMEQKRNPNSKFRDFLKNQGFYVVLALCLVVIGAAVAITALPNGDSQNEQNEAEVIENANASQDGSLSSLSGQSTMLPVIRILPTATPAPTATPQTAQAEVSAPTAATKPASSTTKASPPVSGSVIWEYAMDRLIYSKTLDQWTTHSGVDIGCELGSSVKAVFAGTVDQVYEDDRLGYAVIVSHSSGRKTLYANLNADITVKAGDKVNAGDVLGTVGSSAIQECAEEPHLHFALYIDGKSVDPASYVRLG